MGCGIRVERSGRADEGRKLIGRFKKAGKRSFSTG